eukprot:scaffold239398_cov15-Tisochrysis_lutea.AAC.1
MVDIAIPSGRDSSYILALSRLALGTNRCARAAPRVLPSSAGHRPCRRSIKKYAIKDQGATSHGCPPLLIVFLKITLAVG